MNFLNILAQDKDIITYRKKLNEITGSVTATILLQQLVYWSTKNDHKPFYKFIEPCKNDKYTDGDSWTEELGFSRFEFTNAYKKLEELNIVSKKINMARVTFYTLNIAHLSKWINTIYISEETQLVEVKNVDLDKSKSFDRDYTETKTDIIIKNKQKKYTPLQNEINEKLSEYDNINLQAFNEWVEHKRYKAIAPITKLLNMLSRYSFQQQQQIIDTSIMNGWAGLFELKQQVQSFKPANTLTLQTLNTEVNIWDEIEKQSHAGVIQ